MSYQFDNVGNRLQRNSTLGAIAATGLLNYDANDRTATDPYDANGNLLNGGVGSNVYDFENHLVAAGGVTLVYDGDGNRVKETVATTTTSFLVADQNLTGYAQVMDELQNGSVSRTYSYGLSLISQKLTANGQGLSFYGYDGHGSVRFLLSSTGAVTDTYDYDAFGSLISQTGTTPNNYLFAGEQFDPLLGIYYNRARYYDQRQGRFWTMDTWEGSLEPSFNHHYLYAASNPISKVDPTGMYPQSFGYAVEDAVQDLYRVEFSNSAGKVSFGSEVNDLGIMRGLKPDIFDRSLKKWEDIKPLSLSGIASAAFKSSVYFFNFVYDGYLPGRWPSIRVINVVGTSTLIFGTVEGIIFYTDKARGAEELMNLVGTQATIDTARTLYQLLLQSGSSQVDPLGNLIRMAPNAINGATAIEEEEVAVDVLEDVA